MADRRRLRKLASSRPFRRPSINDASQIRGIVLEQAGQLPVLTASAPARIVTVSSGVQAMGKIDFDDLQSIHSYNEIRVYNQSKLANLLFTYELARRSYDEAVARRLWQVSVELSHLEANRQPSPATR